MRRCNFCKFRCNRISKMAAHIKEKHPKEFRAMSQDRQSGIKEAVEKAVAKKKEIIYNANPKE